MSRLNLKEIIPSFALYVPYSAKVQTSHIVTCRYTHITPTNYRTMVQSRMNGFSLKNTAVLRVPLQLSLTQEYYITFTSTPFVYLYFLLFFKLFMPVQPLKTRVCVCK